MIRVVIGEDSSTVRYILSKIIESDPDITVVGQAKNGEEVVSMAKLLKPDLITMDIWMPGINGFEATREIMTKSPCPILVIAASVNDEDLNIAFNAIHFGALDIVEKPQQEFGSSYESISKIILRKIKILSEVKVIHRRYSEYDQPFGKLKKTSLPTIEKSNYSIIGIVASTGGPVVLKEILSKLPKNFPIPICIVQHITQGFGKGLVTWLNENSELTVKFAKNREYIEPGRVYFAPDDFNMEVTEFGTLRIHQDETHYDFRPCGDVLFSSIAFSYKSKGVGILLTGMGSDGSRGMQIMKQKNAMTIAQDEDSCLVYGMPKEAVVGGCVQKSLNPQEITDFLLRLI